MRYPTNDLEHYFMPFTSNRAFKAKPRLMVSSKGIECTSHDGRTLIDMSSGLFCAPAGHSRPEIADAVSEMLRDCSYVQPFQHGQPAAFELARRLKALYPGDLAYTFFTNSGSESVDTALKIALAYQRAKGQGQRIRLVGRERAYHGVNFGGMSVQGMVKNKEQFGPGLVGVLHMRHTWSKDELYVRGQPENGVELADDLQRFCDLHGADTVAACIVEPVAGSTGILCPPKGYLERLREICDANGILLIFDEVITGFGRIGGNFAGDVFGVKADIMTMAKALTNAAIPMGAVAVTDHVYNTIMDAGAGGVELFHGYTYSAHPAACAAGIAVLDIYEKDGLFERARAMSDYFLDAVFSLKDLPAVTDIRGIGMLAGVDLAAKDGKPGARGGQAVQDLWEEGVLVKMTGDTACIAPPFVSEKSHIDRMAEGLRTVFGRY
jgi:beta-alanine--pyruvate transaminase